jgi:uncharacterized protein YjiK
MTSPTPNLAAVEERLERLEQELRTERRRRRWLAGAVALVVAVVLAWTLATVTATADAQGLKVIRANQFVLDDEKGRPRVWLFVDKNGPRMTMLDETGKAIWSAP